MNIETKHESRRGCGWRKPGGIYLVAPAPDAKCCRLPHILDICPCCGAGIKPTRGWTWVDVDKLFWPNGYDEYHDKCPNNDWTHICPLSRPGTIGKAGLLWIGEQFYATPEAFLMEAKSMGISRRIHSVPRDFKLGETWVLLAHRKGALAAHTAEDGLFKGEDMEIWQPAIFSVFKPAAMEYIVTGHEDEESLEQLVKRGLTPVRVVPVIQRRPK